MDFELSEEQRAIAATVRDFVARELVPHEDLVERLDAVPEELAREIRGKAIAAGLYAANFPAELGGGGLDALGLTLAERELGWTSWALQTLVSRTADLNVTALNTALKAAEHGAETVSGRSPASSVGADAA